MGLHSIAYVKHPCNDTTVQSYSPAYVNPINSLRREKIDGQTIVLRQGWKHRAGPGQLAASSVGATPRDNVDIVDTLKLEQKRPLLSYW